jgi:hypothetical protein
MGVEGAGKTSTYNLHSLFSFVKYVSSIKFTLDVGFTLTTEQQEQEDEEHRKSTDIIISAKCRDLYIENENKMRTCNYHDGFVYDNSAFDLKKDKQSEAMEGLNREGFIALKDPEQKDDIETACFENPEYNERWTDLFTKRRNV